MEIGPVRQESDGVNRRSKVAVHAYGIRDVHDKKKDVKDIRTFSTGGRDDETACIWVAVEKNKVNIHKSFLFSNSNASPATVSAETELLFNCRGLTVKNKTECSSCRIPLCTIKINGDKSCFELWHEAEDLAAERERVHELLKEQKKEAAARKKQNMPFNESSDEGYASSNEESDTHLRISEQSQVKKRGRQSISFNDHNSTSSDEESHKRQRIDREQRRKQLRNQMNSVFSESSTSSDERGVARTEIGSINQGDNQLPPLPDVDVGMLDSRLQNPELLTAGDISLDGLEAGYWSS
eukprot:scaffold5983_cov62-Cyclotella_meneghiniana.AAC.4